LIILAPTHRLRGDDLLKWFALQSVQLCLFLGNSPVQVLALKLGELRSEQPAITLNIPPMAQNFGGTEVSHHAVTLENSVAPSGSPVENRPANAIARIPTARTDPRMAFALHHPSNSRGWLGKSRQTPFPMMTLPRAHARERSAI
jgi:hypothetical protein